MAGAFVSVIATSSVASATSDPMADPPGKVIVTWNGEALNAVRKESVGTPDAARIYAIVNAAMYDAVNGIDRKRRSGGREAALVTERLLTAAPRRGNREAAAVGAAYTVLSRFAVDLEFDTEGPDTVQDRLDAQLAAEMARLDGVKGAERGFKWGETVGDDVYYNRLNDGYRPKETATYGDGPGDFQGEFTSVQYADLEPFAIEEPEDYESDGPPNLRSRAYAVAFNDVKLMGEKGGAEDEEMAFLETVCFWQGPSGSARPPGEWIKITSVVAEGEDTTESISETARLFALQGLAMGDAVIPAWRSKDRYGFWRPRTAIRDGDKDGNRHTEAVQDWVPRNIGKGGSPEHTSGQSTFAGAGSTILAGFYGRDAITFEFAGDNGSERTCGQLVNEARKYDSFSDAAREAGRARILAGIHFEFSNQDGQAAGRGLAREILEESLQPLDDEDDD